MARWRCRGWGFSDDGRLVAYAIADAGSDWQIWRVRDVDTGKDLPDEVRWAKFSGASFSKDGKGFYYSRYAAPLEAEKLTAVNTTRRSGTTPSAPTRTTTCSSTSDPTSRSGSFTATVSDDGRWLVIVARKGTNPERAIFVQDLARPGAKPEPLLARMDASYDFVDVVASLFKGLIENGWVLHNRFLGMPAGFDLYDVPIPDNLHFGLIKLISYFAPNSAATVNIFALLTFPLVTIMSLFVFRCSHLFPAVFNCSQFALRFSFRTIS